MAFKNSQPRPQTDFSDLVATLNKANIQTQNPTLYQTIWQLITKSQQNKDQIFTILEQFFGDIIINDDVDLSAILNLINNLNNIINFATFLTAENESIRLPSSRRLIAGTGITFDDTIPNERTISAVGGSGSVYYAPLTDGNIDETDLIFAAGECIMVPQVI